MKRMEGERRRNGRRRMKRRRRSRGEGKAFTQVSLIKAEMERQTDRQVNKRVKKWKEGMKKEENG